MRVQSLLHLAGAFVATLATLSATWAAAPRLALPSKDEFTLESSYYIDHVEKLGFKRHVRLEESYSRAQQRARLSYVRSGSWSDSKLPSEGTFYVADSQALLVSKENQNCQRVDLGALREALGLDKIGFASSTESNSVEYLVGPIELLIFLDSNRNKFGDAAMGETTIGNRVTNTKQPSIKYQFEYQTGSHKLLFLISYAATSLQLSETIPNRVAILFDDRDMADLVIDFALSYAPTDNQLAQTISDEPQFDRFAVPRALGCPLETDLPVHKLSALLKWPVHGFSFRASFEKSAADASANVAMEMTVAYEKLIDTLRVTTIASSRTSTTISDFRRGRTYNVLEAQSGEIPSVQDSSAKPCVVFETPISSAADRNNPFSLGELLTGGSDFVLLGRAQVRGVQTLAYETSTNLLPIWLEQPVLYKDKEARGEQVLYKSTCLAESTANFRFSTVVYVQDAAESPANQPAKNWLKRVEIYRLDKLRPAENFGRQVIDVYDFSWDVGREAPNGQRIEDFFSLGGACQPENHSFDRHASFNFRLTSEQRPATPDGRDLDWLQATAYRNLAILSELQYNFHLAACSVHDLESRLQLKKPSRERDSSVPNLALSFQWSKPSDLLTQLVFHGVGGVRSAYKKTLTAISSVSFQACFRFVAHLQRETFFGYEPDKELCHVQLTDLQPALSRNPITHEVRPLAFELYARGSIEVYFVDQRDEFNALNGSDLRFLDPLLYYRQSKGFRLESPLDGAAIEFTVQSAEMRLDERPTFAAHADRLVGFGLLEDDKQLNELVQADVVQIARADNTSELHAIDMNFELCQTACHSNPDCQSFSLCQREQGLECVTSRVAFNTAEVGKQLEEKRKSARLGDTLTLEVSMPSGNQTSASTPVHLKRRAGCELHHKRYLDLFLEPSLFLVTKLELDIRQAPSEEDCARKCFESSLATLREAAREWESLEKEDRVELAQSRTIGLVGARLSICSWFMYLSPLKFSSLKPKVQEVIKQRAQLADTSAMGEGRPPGFCILDEPKSRLEAKKRPSEADAIQVEPINFSRHDFNYASFYQQQTGVALLQSDMSPEVSEAVKQVQERRNQADRKHYELVLDFVERHENIRQIVVSDERSCAAHCFTQRYGPWPSCESFDVKPMGRHFKCGLNSVSLREARLFNRDDLIKTYAPDKEARVRHYEPKIGFISAGVRMQRRAAIEATDRATSVARDASLASGLLRFIWNSLVAALGVLAGLAVGFKAGAAYLDRRGASAAGASDDSEARNIVDNLGLEFEAAVEEEGGPELNGRV